jgi:trimethylamine-N-oxide reductase (cytochrome c)
LLELFRFAGFMPRVVLPLIFVAFWTGCLSVEQAAPPVTSTMAAMAGTAPSTLQHGRELFAGRCTACHNPAPLAKYTGARWREIVDEMAGKAHLTPADRSAVLAYILAARQIVAR